MVDIGEISWNQFFDTVFEWAAVLSSQTLRIRAITSVP
jgi:hypothetical protein